MFRGFERPPLWAVIAMVVGVAALAVLAPMAIGRGELSAAEVERINERQQAEAAALAEQTADVLVIGDSYTGGSNEGGTGAAGWPRLVGARLTEDGHNAKITVSAAGGSGYTVAGPTGKDFVQLAQEATGPYDLIVFFGSRNDTAGQETVRAAAAEAFTAVRKSSPDAGLLVIGPPWVDANPPANVQASSRGVKAAVDGAHATWVDPLAEGWFSDQFSRLIGSDGVHPTDEGHQHMAALILPQIEKALGR